MNSYTYDQFLKEAFGLDPIEYKKYNPRDYIRELKDWNNEERYLINCELQDL